MARIRSPRFFKFPCGNIITIVQERFGNPPTRIIIRSLFYSVLKRYSYFINNNVTMNIQNEFNMRFPFFFMNYPNKFHLSREVFKKVRHTLQKFSSSFSVFSFSSRRTTSRTRSSGERLKISKDSREGRGGLFGSTVAHNLVAVITSS